MPFSEFLIYSFVLGRYRDGVRVGAGAGASAGGVCYMVT